MGLTFPVATTANYAVRWFAVSNLPGQEIYSWAILAAATAFTLYIAFRSIVRVVAGISDKRRNDATALV